ncbi:MAG: DUF839 domain-containing protein [Planctomycetes bacterium]|nr:DUF839 domain-containing protein [Planctomycetota bacterium]
MTISRRKFLGSSAAIAAGFFGLRGYVSQTAAGAASEDAFGYGELVPDPLGVLDLPRGFSYRIIGTRGDEMDDGLLLPAAADGMATFAGPDGLTILIRNHELTPDRPGAFGSNNERLGRIEKERLYDYGQGETPSTGGTTTVVYDTKRQKVVRQYLSLAGTMRNCAGGPTPWGSWITCEETVAKAGRDDKKDFVAEKDHGYAFEVPASAEPMTADPVPLKDMGRFNHEAVAVHPKTGIVYETEDRGDGLIYRFLPDKQGELSAGGRLQALVLRDRPSAETRNWKPQVEGIEVGQPLPVEWLDLEEIDSPKDDLRERGFAAGAAQFARGEGMWHGRWDGTDHIFFACTNGGRKQKGQIWRYTPAAAEGTPEEQKAPGKLELFVEPNDSQVLDSADNLTVSPWGDLIVCEDRSGATVRLLGITPQGRLYVFGQNRVNTEFAGSVFSPDGSTLFVNMQGKGLTVAITGPWHEPV